MNKKHLIAIYVSMLLFSGSVYANGVEERAKSRQESMDSCTANLVGFSESQKQAVRKFLLGEDGESFFVEEADLDKDGQNELIVSYLAGLHSLSTKVIRLKGDECEVLFERVSSTPNTDFKIIDGVPTLVFEESDYTPDYNTGKSHEEIYQWDGSKFRKANE